MKKTNRLAITGGFLVCAVAFCGCSFLQGSLSSVQQERLEEATGRGTLSGKAWYYNGIAGEDISDFTVAGSAKNAPQSLKISFNKACALEKLAGSMKLSYRGSDGYMYSKTITELDGKFSDDCKDFYLDMSPVAKYLDGSTIPDGTASVELNVSGFICAEGEQKGRPLSAVKETVAIKPLFNTKAISFSTCWYDHGKSVAEFKLNDDIVFTENSSLYSVQDNGTKINFYAKDNKIIFKPETDIRNIEKEFNIPVYGILSASNGDAFTQTINLKLVKDAIIIDGEVDDNYFNEKASNFIDPQNDQNCFASNWSSSMPDLQEMYIVNDDNNVYIGIKGKLSITWNDGLVLMICKNSDTNNDATSASLPPADNATYWKGRPNVYLYHQPGLNDDGNGNLIVLKGSSKTDISNKCSASPKGWTSSTTGNFIEYAISLADADLARGDTLKVIAATTLRWSNEGNGVCDVLPDSAVRTENATRTNMSFTFEKAAEYKLK